MSGLIALTGFIVNRRTLLTINELKLTADRALAERKCAADIGLAEKRFELDRLLADWMRRTEIAEQVLADFYKAKDIVEWARQPMVFTGEGQSRPGRDQDIEARRGAKDALYAPVERLIREREFFSQMHARRFKFMALFGTDSADAFQTFVRCNNMIDAAARALIEDRQNLPKDVREKFERCIDWSLKEDDEMSFAMNQAVSKIEAVCRQVLRVRPE